MTDLALKSPPGGRQSYLDFSVPARAYARYRVGRLERVDPVAVQSALMLRLLRQAQNTRFGQAHGFAQIADVNMFQQQVPVRDYNAFWTGWWSAHYPSIVNQTWPGRIPYFSMTSGTTTGRSKFIPYTKDMRRAAVRGFLDLLCFHLTRRPESRLLRGAALGLTGPIDLKQTVPGVAAGAVSAITAEALPGFMNHRVLPPADIANLPDWQDKIHRLAQLSLDHDVRFLGGSPNWLLLFLAEVARLFPDAPERLVEWYPDLDIIVHGGVNFAPYREKFSALMEGSHAETREIYSASEGVFAYSDRGDGEGMRLHLDGQVFFEFIPVETLTCKSPERHWVGNAETGVDYALAVSTAAGLWSYLVGDIIRLVDNTPPRLIVVGRVQQGLSAFGEHLIEAEIADALASAASHLRLSVIDYCVGSVREKTGGHHIFLIETASRTPPRIAAQLAVHIDTALRKMNEDYAELREKDYALHAPRVQLVPPGGFAQWMKKRRALGGQNKVPRIVTDEALFDDLCSIVPDRHDGGCWDDH